MHTLYVIYNEPHNDALLRKLLDTNPLVGLPPESAMLYCPECPEETTVLLDAEKELYASGFLNKLYVGRTHFIY